MPQMPEPHSLTACSPRRRRGRRRRAAVALLTAAGLGFTLSVALAPHSSALTGARVEPLRAALPQAPAHTPAGGIAKFPHTHSAHASITCLLCHRRETNDPRPTVPGHTPCAGCHAPQFAARQGPICAVCHMEPGSPKVKPLTALQTFNLRFDHARHTRGAAQAACAACHRSERGGVALSIPADLAAHATCYRCHTPRARNAEGRDISSCGVCHQPGDYARTPEQARAYRVSFSHAKHGEREQLNCANCHAVRAGAPQGRQVTAPAARQHHRAPGAQSCLSCHNGQRAFGGDNFSDCKRCHQGETFRFQ